MSSSRPWYAARSARPKATFSTRMSRSNRALPVGERRVDLGRLGVHEVGLDRVAVPPEQRVGERAVAPVDAAAMEVDEEQRHRVQQPVAVRRRDLAEAHQQAPVLHRVAQVLGHEDRVAALGARREAEGAHRRQARLLEVAQDLELGLGDVLGELLERVHEPVGDEEPDEVPRRPDRQLAERVAGRLPLLERQLPRQVEQARDLVAEAEPGERHRRDRRAGRERVRPACGGTS